MSQKINMPTYEELMMHYSNELCSLSKLAKIYHTSNPTVRKWLNHYNIKIKPHIKICKSINSAKKARKPARDVLEQLYKNHTIDELEKIFATSQNTIYEWLDEYSIERKTLSESIKKSLRSKYEHIQYDKKTIADAYNEYRHYGLAAESLGISVSHFRKLKRDHGIETLTPWRSKAEIELFNFTKQYDSECISNDRTVIYPYEIDILSKKFKLAIEFCGLYWHSENYGGKSNTYHRDKYEMCKRKGYTLLTIFETDDITKVKNLIRLKMGSMNKIYARDTTCVTIDSEIAREYHNKYHLHNSIGGCCHYGLMSKDNQLVGVMSIHKSRYNKNFMYEISRLTFSDIRVIGGTSKLIQTFIRNDNPKSIITYSDLRFGDGNSYAKSGFTRMNNSAPNYWYFHKSNATQLHSRVKFQKHKLINTIEKYDDLLTEYQNMKLNGWDRIWDCGNAVYHLIR